MKYVSTRGQAPRLGFAEVLLAGLARDGGLYVPEKFPRLAASDLRALQGRSYAEIAARVMSPFVSGAIPRAEFERLVAEAYAGFDHAAIAPLRQIGPDSWVMELFHGPTLAFKDHALQLVGRLFDHVLAKRGEHVAIVGATSGDTGAAAIEAIGGRARMEIFMLHPKGRVSEVQRRQMTTVGSANVHNIAIEGTFDDCQALVKAMFNDHAFRDRHRLAAVNSINWARIMAQVAYYFVAGARLGAPERALAFAVPTGNFGNVYAGYVSRRMGLPIRRLIVGSNRNDILTRYLASGVMATAKVVPTTSPSMDIQVSSNFERLLFEAWNRQGERVGAAMEDFRRAGRADFGRERWRRIARLFAGVRLDDRQTTAAIRDIHRVTGEILDPHSAIAVAAGQALHRPGDGALVALATAHPAKFQDAVEAACGARPALPARLADLLARPERCTTLGNDLAGVKAFVAGRLSPRSKR
ncbi:MAG: threonine synthase [Rhodospirillales bacterium]|nr:threonine synthase [Rhodospirillales bacterium]